MQLTLESMALTRLLNVSSAKLVRIKMGGSVKNRPQSYFRR